MIGETISHYRVLEVIGAGGMGVVYKAEDTRLARAVALKFLPADRTHDELTVDRFKREAKTASALNHPNICTIYDIDEHEGAQFIAMELLQGKPLDQRIGGRPLDIGTMLDLSIQIADALDAAHSHGILHRDIKPANIFVTTREQVKVLDFGLAKLGAEHGYGANKTVNVSSDRTGVAHGLLTSKGTVVGTVAYMSPEQARGEELDARSDLFSFGLVLYEMATGRQTFSGNTSAVIFDAILNREPPSPMELNAGVPPDLERIIAKALEKDRRLRYQNASDMRADLQRVKRDRDSGRSVARASAVSATQGQSSSWPSASGAWSAATPAPLPGGSGSGPAAVASPSGSTPAAPGRQLTAMSVALVVAGIVFFVGGGLFFYNGMSWRQTVATIAPAIAPATPVPPATTTPDPAIAATPAASTTPAATPAAPATAPGTPPAAATAGTKPSTTGGTTAGTPVGGTAAGTGARAGGAPVADAAARGAAVPVSPDPAAEAIRIAKAKFDAKLYDQALSTLQPVIASNPTAPSTPAAYVLMANIYERQGRLDDAMAQCVELRHKYRGTPAAGEGTYLMADLLLRSKQPGKDASAREILAELPIVYPNSPFTPRGLLLKATIEERGKMFMADPQLNNASVPAALVTLRTLTDKYPDADGAEGAFAKLAELYEEAKRFDNAASTWEKLGTRFPFNTRDAWWKAAELYEKKVKDLPKARDAYARVAESSKNYKDAQKKAR